MKKGFCTFLMFPGAQGKLRSIRLPFYAVQVVLTLSVAGMMTLAVLAANYARMLLKVACYNDDRNEHEALKSQYRGLENAFRETSAKLNSLQLLGAEVAFTYVSGGAWRSRFPRALLVMATQRPATLDTGYNATVYAFNVLKTIPHTSQRDLIKQNFFADPPYEDSSIPSIWPVQGRITAGFGERMDPLTGEGAFHAGIDIAAPSGTPVEAAADGILFHAGPDAGYGIEVFIDHGYGMTSKYGHLGKALVVVGQEVKRGQVIGTVGTTGRTTGPHLHYEVRIHEAPDNPAKYLPGLLDHREPDSLSANHGFSSQHGGR